jgi:hypothetical protein
LARPAGALVARAAEKARLAGAIVDAGRADLRNLLHVGHIDGTICGRRVRRLGVLDFDGVLGLDWRITAAHDKRGDGESYEPNGRGHPKLLDGVA